MLKNNSTAENVGNNIKNNGYLKSVLTAGAISVSAILSGPANAGTIIISDPLSPRTEAFSGEFIGTPTNGGEGVFDTLEGRVSFSLVPQTQYGPGYELIANYKGLNGEDIAYGVNLEGVYEAIPGIFNFSVAGDPSAFLQASNTGKNSYAIYTGNNGITFSPIPLASPIPEPGTAAMMLGGLGVVAAIARRRKAQEDAAQSDIPTETPEA